MNSSIGPQLPLTIDKKNGFISTDNYTQEIKQKDKWRGKFATLLKSH